jgi:hypothetical protein
MGWREGAMGTNTEWLKPSWIGDNQSRDDEG